MKVKLEDIEEIIKLSKLSKGKLKKMNMKLDRAYVGSELTKIGLIYQITFLRDAPFK